MSEKETGGSAFPVTPTDKSGQIAPTELGMTLRDYFAAKAMQGWMANPTATPVEAGIDSSSPQDLADVAAVFGYMVADAMMESRKA